jgi:hypothetical protein
MGRGGERPREILPGRWAGGRIGRGRSVGVARMWPADFPHPASPDLPATVCLQVPNLEGERLRRGIGLQHRAAPLG